MIGGVSFQPGADPMGASPNGGARPASGSGVQEAIKILSLRLPRVVGSQAASSLPLLTSQGSGGNSRVESIVNQVLARVPGGQQPPVPMQPSVSAPAGSPSFGGSATPSYQPAEPSWTHAPAFGTPRVIVEGGRPAYTQQGLPVHPRTGQPMSVSEWEQGGFPAGMIEELPTIPLPPPPPSNPLFGELGRAAAYSGGGYEGPFEPRMI